MSIYDISFMNPVSGISGSDALSYSKFGMSADSKKMLDLAEKYNQKERSWSAKQAQKQMDFQKMMSDTAHQREVADLQAAGLNPVLSAGGSGAPSGSGAMADSNSLSEVLPGILSAMNYQQELNLKQSEVDANKLLNQQKFNLDMEKFRFEQEKWSDQLAATAAKLLSSQKGGAGGRYPGKLWNKSNFWTYAAESLAKGYFGMDMQQLFEKVGSEGLGFITDKLGSDIPLLGSLFGLLTGDSSAKSESDNPYSILNPDQKDDARFGSAVKGDHGRDGHHGHSGKFYRVSK